MIDHVREHLNLYLLILLWLVAAVFGGPVIYALLPLSVIFLRSRSRYPDMLFGLLMVLILSDVSPGFLEMRKFKDAKYLMMIAISGVVILDRRIMVPMAGLFKVFAPFFLYALFPIVNGSDPVTGVSKTVSYGLLFLAVPNYVLYSFRQYRWEFIRNLILFIFTILAVSYLIYYVYPVWVSLAGRYRGPFGNPNGLGIFCFLTIMLVTVATEMNKDVLSFREKLIVFGALGLMLVQCGSRTSLMATIMFVGFSRFFRLSPFLGFIGFILFLFAAEMVSSNLPQIVIALGLQEYFRVETLDDGSGRYFAWSFGWQKINEGGFFLFGGGFGNDEWVMRHNYVFLRSMGHHGGVHNSYLTMWFNTGLFGLLIFFRSFFLIFFKANKRVPIAFAVMFATMFSVLYESWLTGSLNPFTILLVAIMTILTEDEIVEWRSTEPVADAIEPADGAADPAPGPPLAGGTAPA